MINPQTITEAKRTLGRQLAALREAAGKTQDQLAKQINYGRSTIANAETGYSTCRRTFWEHADQALHADGALLRGYDELQILTRHHHAQTARLIAQRRTAAIQTRRDQQTTLLADPEFMADWVEGAPRAAGGTSESGHSPEVLESPDAKRRALLRGVAVVAAASGLLGGDAARLGRRIGRSDVARLNAVTGLYRSLDYEVGGGLLAAEVGIFAESASALLDLSYAEALAPSVLSAVAAARQLAGWTAFDAGLHSDAQRHFLSAERAASAADDRLMMARVRYCQARQYQHLRHNRDALDTLRLARHHLGDAATPAVGAMLHGAEAASLAAVGEWQPGVSSLGKARDAFERVDAANEPEWMDFYDQGEVLAQYGRVYRDIARADRRSGPVAVQWVTDAIAAFGAQNVRSAVLNEVGLCSALFLANEPERAVAVGLRVVDQAKDLTSRRIVDRITNLRRDLVRHRSHPDVAEFARVLATIGASAS